MLSVGLNLKPFFIGGFTPTDPNAAIFIEAAGFQDNALKEIIDNVFLSIKSLNSGATYNKISLMRLFIGESTNNTTALNQCLLNAINPATYAPTLISNSPTANKSGLECNGVNQYYQCGFNPSTDAKWALNSATFINYAYLPATNTILFGRRNNSIATNRQIYLQPLGISNVQINNGINDATGGVVFSPTAQNVSGFHAATRNAANNTKIYFWRNNQISQTGVIPNGVTNINMPFGAYSDTGGTSPIFTGAQRHQFDLYGSGFTTSELASMETIVNNLQGSLDTLFGLTGTNARKRY